MDAPTLSYIARPQDDRRMAYKRLASISCHVTPPPEGRRTGLKQNTAHMFKRQTTGKFVRWQGPGAAA